MADVIWSPEALQDVVRLREFLLARNSDAARLAIAAIRQGTLTLAEHPEIGRPVLEMPPEFREWPVPFGGSSYLVFYRYDGRRVTILAVRHGREVGY